jgi:thymidylate synthase
MPAFADLEQIVKTTPDQYILHGYNPMDSIKAPMAV